MDTHHLKCWPEPFGEVWKGTKTHEVRVFDRDFKPGDMLRLFEYDPANDAFSGRYVRADVRYVTKPGTWGLPQNIGVMSILPLEARMIGADRARRWCSQESESEHG